MFIAFGIVFLAVAAAGFWSAAYMGYHDYNGTGITKPRRISGFPIMNFLIGLAMLCGSIAFFANA